MSTFWQILGVAYAATCIASGATYAAFAAIQTGKAALDMRPAGWRVALVSTGATVNFSVATYILWVVFT
jgi:hypothetical protein